VRNNRFISFLVILIFTLFASQTFSTTTLVKIAPDIPKWLDISAHRIFTGSDSLYLNRRLLVRGDEYSFIPGQGRFDLSRLAVQNGDSLIVVFEPLPLWIEMSVGRRLPEAGGEQTKPVESEDIVSLARPQLSGRTIKLSGAKTFRYSAQSSGSAEFGQSLDLSVDGELSDGVELSGSISDRGFDPSYGTLNSQISELDKLNLVLKSKRLLAQVGDISISDRQYQSGSKSITGTSFALTYPDWHAGATAARPKGTFTTQKFIGQNGFQGPYQLGANSGASPVVPGSETVWLDGRRLERGSNKDYVFDYPLGRITFTVTTVIDSRSRVEVDFEPQATNYRKELVAGESGVSLHDSSYFLSVSALREGDDKERPLIGNFSETEQDLLAESGDFSTTRSGVAADTNGSYILFVDSLPDSVYQYVGKTNGDIAVTFSFVGQSQGSYQFLGDDRFNFVGLGRGEYLPVVILPRAERLTQYRSLAGWRTELIGTVTADIRSSSEDRNLWSTHDDENNDGLYYALELDRPWKWNGQKNSVTMRRRSRESAFRTRERIDNVDFDRSFFLPANYQTQTAELLHDFSASLFPHSAIEIKPYFADIDYDRSFRSRTGGLDGKWMLSDRLNVDAGGLWLLSKLADSGSERFGRVNGYYAGSALGLHRTIKLNSRYEHDRRVQNYLQSDEGARFDRAEISLGNTSGQMSYEKFIEDSLPSAATWYRSLERDRISLKGERKFGNLGYELATTYQWAKRSQSDEENFLARTALRYDNSARRLRVHGSYLVSDERRNARGIGYLEVQSGQGQYTLDDRKYIPDPIGNFIQVEEILSGAERVRRGERSFYFDKEAELFAVRMNSRIEEELLRDGKRTYWWIVPFLSDGKQPYLFYSRHYDGQLQLLPFAGFYFATLSASEDIQIRQLSGTAYRREDSKGRLALKQRLVQTYFEEAADVFRGDQDNYYGDGGAINGYKLLLTIRQVIGVGEVSAGGSYREAASESQRAETFSILSGARLNLFRRGELRANFELYRQTLPDESETVSYRLTDNKYGLYGALWTTVMNYGIRGGLKLSLSFTGRHSDARSGRVSGRGEVIAEF